MYIPEIPQNDLKERIETIVEFSKKLTNEFFEFEKPLSDKEIEEWESENNIKIPDSYKDWLHFSRCATIGGTAADFYEPNDFITDIEEKPYGVPDECVVIGELGGWGVSVCFYEKTGEIMYIDHDDECRNLEFGDILDWVIDRLESCM